MHSTPEAILAKWRADLDTTYASMSPFARQGREKLKEAQPPRIWLGSPAPGGKLDQHRELLRKVLEGEGCTVELSNVEAGNYATEAEPAELGRGFDLLFLVVASPGTSAEAMELALSKTTKNKLHVFLPKEFKSGYLARSLQDRHKVLCNLSFFSLAGTDRFESDIAQNMVHTVVKWRNQRENWANFEHAEERVIQHIANVEHMSNIYAKNAAVASNSPGATVSNAVNAVNSVTAKYGPSVGNMLDRVNEHIAKSGNEQAVELMDGFNEELAKPAPRKSMLKGLWEKIGEILPSAVELVKASGEFAKLLGAGGQ